MLKFKVDIGREEIHEVEFELNQHWGASVINIDGHKIIQKFPTFRIGKTSKTFEFTIGETEKHCVKIEVIRSLFPSGIKECTAWVYDNEEKFLEQQGVYSLKDKLFSGVGLKAKIPIIALLVL